MFGKAKGWTAIESRADGRVFVASVRNGSPSLKPVVIGLDADNDGRFSPAILTKLARGASAGRTAWVLVLQRTEYALPVVARPSVAPSETEQALRWSLAPTLDFHVDDAVVSWLDIPTADFMPQRPQQVYAIAARKSAVVAQLDAFRAAKLTLRAVDIRETAQRNLSVALADRDSAVLFLSDAQSDILLTLTYRGELYLDRHIRYSFRTDSAAGQAGADPRATCRRVALEVMRTIDLIQRQFPFIPVQRIVLAPVPALPDLFDILSSDVNVTVERLDLEAIFDISRVPQLNDPVRQAEYLIVLGAALRDSLPSGRKA